MTRILKKSAATSLGVALQEVKTMFTEDIRLPIDTTSQLVDEMAEVEQELSRTGRRAEDVEIHEQWNEMKGIIKDRLELGRKEQMEFMVMRMEHFLAELGESTLESQDGRHDLALSKQDFATCLDDTELKASFLSQSEIVHAGASNDFPKDSICSFDSAKRPTKKRRNLSQTGSANGIGKDGTVSAYLVLLAKTVIVAGDSDGRSGNLIDFSCIIRRLCLKKDGVEERQQKQAFFEQVTIRILMKLSIDACSRLIKCCRSFSEDDNTIPRRELRCLALSLSTVGTILPSLPQHPETFQGDAAGLLVTSLGCILCCYSFLFRCPQSQKTAESLHEVDVLLHEALLSCGGQQVGTLPALVDMMLMAGNGGGGGNGNTTINRGKFLKHSSEADLAGPVSRLLQPPRTAAPWHTIPKYEVSMLLTEPRGIIMNQLTADCLATCLLSGGNDYDGAIPAVARSLSRLHETSLPLVQALFRSTASICSSSDQGGLSLSRLRAVAVYLKVDLTATFSSLSLPVQSSTTADPRDGDGISDYSRFLVNIKASERAVRAALDASSSISSRDHDQINTPLLALLCSDSLMSIQARWEQAHVMSRLLCLRRSTTAENGEGTERADEELRSQVVTFLAKRGLAYYIGAVGTANAGALLPRLSSVPAQHLLFTPMERSLGFDVAAGECPSALHQLSITSRLQIDLLNKAIVDNEVARSGDREDPGAPSLFFDGALLPNLAAFTYYQLHLGQAMLILQQQGRGMAQGQQAGDEARYPGLPALPSLWRERRHMLVAPVLTDALYYYLRILAVLPTGSAQDQTTPLRYVSVALDLLVCTACEGSHDDCMSAVAACVDADLFSLCLECLVKAAARSYGGRDEAGSLIEALYQCLRAVQISLPSLTAHRLRLRHILPLLALCSIALDLEVRPSHATIEDLARLVAGVTGMMWAGINFKQATEFLYSSQGPSVPLAASALPVAANATSSQFSAGPLRSALAKVIVPAIDSNSHGAGYAIIPARPLQALFRRIGMPSEAGGVASPAGSMKGVFIPGFVPSLQESKAALYLCEGIGTVAGNAYDTGTRAHMRDVVQGLHSLHLRTWDTGGVMRGLEDIVERLRLVSLILHKAYTMENPPMETCTWLSDLHALSEEGCRIKDWSSQELSLLMTLLADQWQRQAISTVTLHTDENTSSASSENIAAAILGLLQMWDASDGPSHSPAEGCFLPFLQIWCVQHALSKAESERHWAESLALLRHWQDALVPPQAPPLSEESWRADVNFASASLGCPEVPVSLFEAAQSRRLAMSPHRATSAPHSSRSAQNGEKTSPHSSPVISGAGGRQQLAPGTPSSSGSIRLGAIIHGGSRSAPTKVKRKARHNDGDESVTVDREGREADRLGLAMEVVAEREDDRDGAQDLSTSLLRKQTRTLPTNSAIFGAAGVAGELLPDLPVEPIPRQTSPVRAPHPPATQSQAVTEKTIAPVVVEEHRDAEENDTKQDDDAAEGWVASAAAAITKKFGASF